MTINEVRALIENQNYQQAIEECKRLLETCSNQPAELLRLLADTYWLQGNCSDALIFRKQIVSLGDAELKDYYLGAETSIEAGDLSQAKQYLLKLLEISEESKESWFDSAAYFYLSYIEMKMNRNAEALRYLDKYVDLEPELPMVLPSGETMTHKQLRAEIARQQKTKRVYKFD